MRGNHHYLKSYGAESLCSLRKGLLIVGLALLVAAASPSWAQTTWYVDDDAANDPGAGDPAVSDPLEDGSLAHPFDAIQEAIDASAGGDTVLIADGTYAGAGNKNLDFGGRAITVRSSSGDPELCIIDCEDDGRGFFFHTGEGADSVVEGITITNGYVDRDSPDGDAGGGVYCGASSPTFQFCVIRGCQAVEDDGGGVFCAVGAPVFTSCLITGNYSQGSGGGIYSVQSEALYEQCVITGNTALEEGGGVLCGSSNDVFRECAIENNMSYWSGGGMTVSYGSAILQSCTFAGNVASRAGGGLYLHEDSAVLVGCTIRDCTAMGDSEHPESVGGGGIMCYYSNASIIDCTIENNTTNVYGVHGGGVCCWEDDARFTHCVFRNNAASGKGGGLFTRRSESSFDNCLFVDNTAGYDGGGIAFERYSHTSLNGSTVANNTAGVSGGGLHCYGLSCDVILSNTTIWGNSCVEAGQQISLTRVRTLDVSYCDVEAGMDDIENLDGDSDSIIWGVGNIDADPMFLDPENGDYRLAAGSPCIDAGSNCAVPNDWADLDGDGDVSELLPLDLEGEGRFFDDPDTLDTGGGLAPIVDMGAYEFGGSEAPACPADIDGDRGVDLSDLSILLNNYGMTDAHGYEGDLDCDGDVDLSDLATVLGWYGSTCDRGW